MSFPKKSHISKAKAAKPLAASPSKEGVYVANATYLNNKVKSTEVSADRCYADETNNLAYGHHILLTRDELASRWKYCIETLKRWEKAGKLPFLVLGKEIRYRLSTIIEIEANSEVPA